MRKAPDAPACNREGSRWQRRGSAVRPARTSRRLRLRTRRKKTITKLSGKTRSALGREGAKAAARKRCAHGGPEADAGAMTVTELRREVARLGIDGRSRMGRAQLIRAVGQKRG